MRIGKKCSGEGEPMMGMKTCATCKHFVPLSMMSREERRAFIDACTLMGIDNPEDYGYCKLNEDDIVIVGKTDGKNCKYWEAK